MNEKKNLNIYMSDYKHLKDEDSKIFLRLIFIDHIVFMK
jgi:hypothetical protein|uniref:Uncharacterized protein n=1 Tax=viral metagenome TaxID=1070528 RepID=A0A6C0CXM5_9ZZZZ